MNTNDPQLNNLSADVELYWVRTGDSCEYDWQPEAAAIGEVLAELNVKNFRFSEPESSSAFADGFEGANHISIFVGDKEGEMIRALNYGEREAVLDKLRTEFIVNVREVWVQENKVLAMDKHDAWKRVRDGHGEIIEKPDALSYSDTCDPDTWSVKDTDGNALLGVGQCKGRLIMTLQVGQHVEITGGEQEYIGLRGTIASFPIPKYAKVYLDEGSEQCSGIIPGRRMGAWHIDHLTVIDKEHSNGDQ